MSGLGPNGLGSEGYWESAAPAILADWNEEEADIDHEVAVTFIISDVPEPAVATLVKTAREAGWDASASSGPPSQIVLRRFGVPSDAELVRDGIYVRELAAGVGGIWMYFSFGNC